MVNRPQHYNSMTKEDGQKSEIAARLIEARTTLGHEKVRPYAIAAGIDPSQYAKAEKGDQQLGPEKLYGLSTTYSIRLEWLIAGAGNMLISNTDADPANLLRMVINNQGIIATTSEAAIKAVENTTKLVDKILPTVDYLKGKVEGVDSKLVELTQLVAGRFAAMGVPAQQGEPKTLGTLPGTSRSRQPKRKKEPESK